MGYLDFRDQVVVVTGASSAIGAAAAVGFAETGATLALHYHRTEEGAKHTVGAVQAAGGTATLHQADLADPKSADAFDDEVLAQHGRIDVLVNNAGDLVKRSPVADVPDEEFHRILDVNLTSVFALSRRIVPVFRVQGGGAIVQRDLDRRPARRRRRVGRRPIDAVGNCLGVEQVLERRGVVVGVGAGRGLVMEGGDQLGGCQGDAGAEFGRVRAPVGGGGVHAGRDRQGLQVGEQRAKGELEHQRVAFGATGGGQQDRLAGQ